MKERYLPVEGDAQTETAAAFCLRNVEFDLDGTAYKINQMWVPKSNTHDDSLDTVDEAAREDRIEVFVASWWLREQI